jgi:hypothetical protein
MNDKNGHGDTNMTTGSENQTETEERPDDVWREPVVGYVVIEREHSGNRYVVTHPVMQTSEDVTLGDRKASPTLSLRTENERVVGAFRAPEGIERVEKCPAGEIDYEFAGFGWPGSDPIEGDQ